MTGEEIKEKPEVKQNKIAHKEFLRIKKLLKNIEKNDDLYGVVINRYCLLYAECFEFEKKREKMFEQLCDLQEKEDELIEHEEMTQKEFYGIENSMQKNLIALDRQVQSKRKMLLEIEKENIMTIASALRSVPKKTEKKKNPLMEALNGS
ncbi:hypothetical protein ACWTCY_12310 [Anaerostipes caccae]|uniref:hypothetical protein n=1 Tax=Anaerostipes caccae TaxID=105841 RepID=UPI00241D4F59|nr:hypothetical protein [Anaerostipes caccae]